MEEKVTCSDRHRSIASNLKEKLSSIKSFLEDRLIRHIRGEDVEITRIYHVWPGKNVFFLHGRLICGPDPRGLLLTSVSILLSSWIFAVYIGDDLPDHSILIVKFSLVLARIVCRYHPIEEEYNSPTVSELQKYITDEDYSVTVGFYILLRAMDRFSANYNSFPRQIDGAMDKNISRLKTTAVGLLSDLGCNRSTIAEDLINEMCRFGAAELHAVAAFIGGIASQ